MRKINNIILCGLGAIGSIYADKIQNYSPENLKILVDKSRLQKYLNSPVIFNGKKLNLNYILPECNDFKADLIIISTKFDGLNEVIKNIKAFVKKDTIIISLLNGVTSEDIIAQTYGHDKILYSYVIGHSAVRNGRNITHDGVNKIVFGSKISDDNKVELVKAFFNKCGINYEVPEDIMHALWLKYVLNVTSNQTSAVLRLTFGDMQSNPKCLKFLSNISKEVIEIAKAEGVQDTEKFLTEYNVSFNSMNKDGKTSMLQDVEAGRKTEVEMFAGTVVKLGEKYGILTPYNKILKELIEIIEYKNNNLL